MTHPGTNHPEYHLVDLVEEYTAPAALEVDANEVDLTHGVLNVVEDVLNPSFKDGRTIDEQIENSAFDCASIYRLPDRASFMANLAHRIMRDSRMAEMAPRVIKLFQGDN